MGELSKLSNMLKKIIYIKNYRNAGVAHSWNQGIKIGHRENSSWFLISNNDIVFRADSIDNLLAFARKTNYGMTTSIDTQRCFGQDPFTFQPREEEWAGLCWSCFLLQGWLIDKVGHFDEHYWPAYMEDQDFEHRLNLQGLEKRSTFMSVIKHNEGATGRGNKWKLGQDCNTHSQLYYYAYIKNKNYFGDKWKIGNKYGKSE